MDSLASIAKRVREERGMSTEEIVKWITFGWPPARIEMFKGKIAAALEISERDVIVMAGPRPTPKIVSG